MIFSPLFMPTSSSSSFVLLRLAISSPLCHSCLREREAAHLPIFLPVIFYPSKYTSSHPICIYTWATEVDISWYIASCVLLDRDMGGGGVSSEDESSVLTADDASWLIIGIQGSPSSAICSNTAVYLIINSAIVATMIIITIGRCDFLTHSSDGAPRQGWSVQWFDEERNEKGKRLIHIHLFILGCIILFTVVNLWSNFEDNKTHPNQLKELEMKLRFPKISKTKNTKNWMVLIWGLKKKEIK